MTDPIRELSMDDPTRLVVVIGGVTIKTFHEPLALGGVSQVQVARHVPTVWINSALLQQLEMVSPPLVLVGGVSSIDSGTLGSSATWPAVASLALRDLMLSMNDPVRLIVVIRGFTIKTGHVPLALGGVSQVQVARHVPTVWILSAILQQGSMVHPPLVSSIDSSTLRTSAIRPIVASLARCYRDIWNRLVCTHQSIIQQRTFTNRTIIKHKKSPSHSKGHNRAHHV